MENKIHDWNHQPDPQIMAFYWPYKNSGTDSTFNLII